jgi:hypothetical protein
MKYDVFLICPVRNATDDQKAWMKGYIEQLEDAGMKVYYPARDTDQNDNIGFRICEDNRSAIFNSKEIHIFWDKDSQGSLFDLGMAFMMNKPLVIVNKIKVVLTDSKSFSNMILEWDRQTHLI